MNHDLPFFYADGHSGLYCGKFAPWVSFTLRLSCICVIVVSYLLGFCGRCCCTISCALLQTDNLTDPCSICLHVLLGGFPYPTINDRDLLEFLLEGERMEKPTNCTDEM